MSASAAGVALAVAVTVAVAVATFSLWPRYTIALHTNNEKKAFSLTPLKQSVKIIVITRGSEAIFTIVSLN